MNATRIVHALAASAAFAAAGSAQAVIVLGNGDSVSLATVMSSSDRMVMIDDKLFTFESYSSSVFEANELTLIGFISANGSPGFRNVGFDLTGPFGDGSPGDGHVHEANLQYSVAVTDDAYARGIRLCDVRSVFNGSSGGDGSFARVDESVFDLDNNVFLGQLSVWDIAGPPRDTKLSDYADYCDLNQSMGYRAFEVNKDMKFFAALEGGFATASFIRQEF
ncbi:MAG: hypothetical protein EBU70_10005, partial [Actinobacteria bacterium]|nr:hypothetical protein [Actinomycetota bacterium]